MISKNIWVVGLVALVGGMLLFADPALAQGFGGSGFESRIKGFTDNIISVILPAVAILGLLYAALLAASGDEGAKRRMVLVVIASVIGFLAPVIIRWFQSAVGG
ncbi:MAG: TrbC/VirB2 family protein [Bdellovibrionales bacterium]|nr:TrbC/VirB2 family protein [Bdellovibrionales bacterium]